MSETLAGQIKVLSGWAFPSGGFNQLDGLPLIRIRDLGRGTTEVKFKGDYDPAYLVDDGDVLIGMDGDFAVQKWTGGAALLNQRVCKVESASEALDQEFLYWYLMPHVADIHRKTPQTTVRHLSARSLSEIAVPPIPVFEQRAVNQILDTFDTTIRQTEAIIEKLKQVRQGLLHDLLTRGIDADGKLRPPRSEAPHLYKESVLGWIPRDWAVDSLSSNADVAGGVTLGRVLTGAATLELPYLRVANVQDGYLDLSDVKTTRILAAELPRYRIEPGDVLMNEGGDFDKLGRGVMWAGQIDTCLHQNHVFRVRCRKSSLDPRYLTAYSSSSFGKAFFVQASKQTTNLASINSTQLKGFPLRLPALAEQAAIVNGLEALNARIETELAILQKYFVQRAGLMEDLLSGRVRVTPLLA